MAPRVLHVSTYDANGGAARAAYALHRAMVDADIDSRMVVGRKDTNDPTVASVSPTRFRLSSELDRRISRLQRSPVRTWRSAARLTTLTAAQINRTPADVVNLHWVTDGLLSIEEIGRIEKPVVWSMYDMWPFAGTEHYCPDGTNSRWREGYSPQNRLQGEHGADIDRWTFERKSRLWGPHRNQFHLVPASAWLADVTRASSLMASWQITRIPHVVSDIDFQPMDRAEARAALELPADPPTVLFLASAGVADHRKGFDLLQHAMAEVKLDIPDLHLAIAGPVPSGGSPQTDSSVTWLGELRGNQALRAAYSAADVVAAPSREDNMPLTAMEAQTCGRPVVAFRIGGLPDIVSHGETGFLAEPFDINELATGLRLALGNHGSWGSNARHRAKIEWSPESVVPRYQALYEAAQR